MTQASLTPEDRFKDRSGRPRLKFQEVSMSYRNLMILALMLLALGVVPAAALAASSSASGYGGVGGSVQSSIDPSLTRASAGGSSQLPFTGFDALALGAVGVLLTGLGVTLRVLGRRTVRRREQITVRFDPPRFDPPLHPALERERV